MPEEINRIITDHLSDILFCPNKNAKKNLINERINGKIFISGDIMLDSFKFFEEKIKTNDDSRRSEYVLATIHREENTNDRKKLEDIFTALDKVNLMMPVVLPLHPRTSKLVEKFNIKTNINFVEPLGYFEFLKYLINSSFVVTDSGGLQKEAFFAKKNA